MKKTVFLARLLRILADIFEFASDIRDRDDTLDEEE